jgi:hypothetical protein
MDWNSPARDEAVERADKQEEAVERAEPGVAWTLRVRAIKPICGAESPCSTSRSNFGLGCLRPIGKGAGDVPGRDEEFGAHRSRHGRIPSLEDILGFC